MDGDEEGARVRVRAAAAFFMRQPARGAEKASPFDEEIGLEKRVTCITRLDVAGALPSRRRRRGPRRSRRGSTTPTGSKCAGGAARMDGRLHHRGSAALARSPSCARSRAGGTPEDADPKGKKNKQPRYMVRVTKEPLIAHSGHASVRARARGASPLAARQGVESYQWRHQRAALRGAGMQCGSLRQGRAVGVPLPSITWTTRSVRWRCDVRAVTTPRLAAAGQIRGISRGPTPRAARGYDAMARPSRGNFRRSKRGRQNPSARHGDSTRGKYNQRGSCGRVLQRQLHRLATSASTSRLRRRCRSSRRSAIQRWTTARGRPVGNIVADGGPEH